MTVLHPLTDLPTGAALRSVTTIPTEVDNRAALRVQLTDEVAHEGRPGVDYVDQPTFVIIPAEFGTGTVEVDLRAGLTDTAPDDARGFAGPASHLVDGGDRFETVYLRPLNGARSTLPPHGTSVRSSAPPIPAGPSPACVRPTPKASTGPVPTSSPTGGSTWRWSSPTPPSW